MAYGTGLVGATLAGLEPIIEGDAPRSPRFKYFAEAHEDAFRSFLSVPIQHGEVQIGVLSCSIRLRIILTRPTYEPCGRSHLSWRASSRMCVS